MSFRLTTSIEKDNEYMSCPHTHIRANTPHFIFVMLHNSPNFMLFYTTLALTLSLSSLLSARQEQRNNFNSHCCCCCGCRQTKKSKEGSQYLTVNVCTVCTFRHQQQQEILYMNIQFLLCVPYCYCCCCCFRLFLQL